MYLTVTNLLYDGVPVVKSPVDLDSPDDPDDPHDLHDPHDPDDPHCSHRSNDLLLAL